MMEQNHEYYVSFEVAKLLKEAGFDWEVNHFYFTQNGKTEVKSDFRHPAQNYNESMATMDSKSFEFEVCSRPTLDVAQRWLREIKGYYVAWEFNMNISPWGSELYDFADISVYIFVDSERGNICKCRLKENYKTVEDAQEAGIREALEIILEKGK